MKLWLGNTSRIMDKIIMDASSKAASKISTITVFISEQADAAQASCA